MARSDIKIFHPPKLLWVSHDCFLKNNGLVYIKNTFFFSFSYKICGTGVGSERSCVCELVDIWFSLEAKTVTSDTSVSCALFSSVINPVMISLRVSGMRIISR